MLVKYCILMLLMSDKNILLHEMRWAVFRPNIYNNEANMIAEPVNTN